MEFPEDALFLAPRGVCNSKEALYISRKILAMFR
jgi:hypothetical protein